MSLQTTAALRVAAGLEPAIYPLPMIRRGPGQAPTGFTHIMWPKTFSAEEQRGC